jgi:hypothetical protein
MAVQAVLKIKARSGQTTKNSTTHLVWKKIEKMGGPTKYGIGAAAMHMAVLHIIENEVTRQLKMPLTDHARDFVLPPSIRADVKDVLVKVPRWIAIEDGPDAIWMNTLAARHEHWQANAQLKEKKAVQTQMKANISLEVALFLETNGFANLDEAIRS